MGWYCNYPGNVSVIELKQKLDGMDLIVQDLLQTARESQKLFADKKRKFEKIKVNDLVLVKRECISLDYYKERRADKLLSKFVGPFKIIENLNEVSFKLHMHKKLKCHNVFHITDLKLYVPPQDSRKEMIPEPDVIENEIEYEIEKILDCRMHKRKIQYLVKWVGFPKDENEWLFVEQLSNAKELLTKFRSDLGTNRNQGEECNTNSVTNTNSVSKPTKSYKKGKKTNK